MLATRGRRLSRLERYDRALLTQPPGSEMTQFVREGDRFVPGVYHVGVTERPPMIQVAGYHERSMRPS